MNFGKLQVGRLERIKETVGHLRESRLSQHELAGQMNLSAASVRKNLRLLREANVVIQLPADFSRELFYQAVENDAAVDGFVALLDDAIAAGSNARVRDRKAKPKGDIVVGRLFEHHHIAPGRTIYRALDN